MLTSKPSVKPVAAASHRRSCGAHCWIDLRELRHKNLQRVSRRLMAFLFEAHFGPSRSRSHRWVGPDQAKREEPEISSWPCRLWQALPSTKEHTAIHPTVNCWVPGIGLQAAVRQARDREPGMVAEPLLASSSQLQRAWRGAEASRRSWMCIHRNPKVSGPVRATMRGRLHTEAARLFALTGGELPKVKVLRLRHLSSLTLLHRA